MTEPMAAQQAVRSFEEWWITYESGDRVTAYAAWHARDTEIAELARKEEVARRTCNGNYDWAKREQAKISELREMVRELVDAIAYRKGDRPRQASIAAEQLREDDVLARATKLLQPQDVKEKDVQLPE